MAGERFAHQAGALGRMRPGVVQQHDRRPTARRGARHEFVELQTQRLGVAARAEAEAEPAVPPVHRAEAQALLVVARRPDQTLPPSSLGTPDARERRVQGHLDLVLQVEIGSGEQAQEVGHVGRQFRQQIRLPERGQERRQRMRGWTRGGIRQRRRGGKRSGSGRSRRDDRPQVVVAVGQGGRQQQLRPQAFPT